MTYAETLTESERRRGRICAYFACLAGCVSEVMLDSSAIIILFVSMLGGGDMLMMAINSFSGLLGTFMMIPCVALIVRIGMKRSVFFACLTGCCGFLLMACSPYFGRFSCLAAAAGCFIYASQRALYGAAWYPMLDVFLRPEERGKFFGTMRFFYMSFSAALFFVIGMLMGKEPPLWLMQAVIGAAGLLLLGRYYCISRFPEDNGGVREIPDIRKSLGISARNGPLTSYSVYSCLLSIAFSSQMPLTYIYLKKYVMMAPGTVQILSSVGLSGAIAGYFCYGRLLNLLGVKRLELAVHLSYIVSAALFAFVDCRMDGFATVAGAVLFLMSFTGSTFMCNNSGELLALARPGNKAMAMAFIQTYSNAGSAIGRLSTSVILGAAVLAPTWELGEKTISHYQTLYLFFGAILLVLLLLLPTLPSFVPTHEDYYEPKK